MELVYISVSRWVSSSLSSVMYFPVFCSIVNENEWICFCAFILKPAVLCFLLWHENCSQLLHVHHIP